MRQARWLALVGILVCVALVATSAGKERAHAFSEDQAFDEAWLADVVEPIEHHGEPATVQMGAAGATRSAIVAPMTIEPTWTAASDQVGSGFGVSVATSGDVNGDGYDDVIVAAYSYSNGQDNEGRVFVYHGSAAGLSTTPDWTTESNQADAYFGGSVSSAGDVNGDGYDDLIVGACCYDDGQVDEGGAFVYHGSAVGLSTSPDWTAKSNQATAYFGESVGAAGDVNGDGYDDVIVGALAYDNGQTDEGGAFVYHGSAAGLSTTPVWTGESNQADAHFGESVGAAGDVDGDGYDDVIVGAIWYDSGQTNEGGAFVYHGSAAGLSVTPNWTAESNQDFAYFGESVAKAGDANGDGYDDVIVGARLYDNRQGDEGGAFVYHGSAAGLSVTPNWTAWPYKHFTSFGISVGAAGDVNGDGYDDVIVGAPLYNDIVQLDEGWAFVFHGSNVGLSSSPNWAGESNQDFAYFGGSVGTAGDANGDGYDDVIVGAFYVEMAFVYRGRQLP
jgi:hypothetical protein